MTGSTQTSLIDRLLDDYERHGWLPLVTGGDHEDDDGGGDDDSNATSSGKSGKESSEQKSGREKDEKSGGFKPITTQEDLDAVLTKRLARQARTLRDEIAKELKDEAEAEAAKKAAEEQGDFKKLYEESQAEIEKLKKKIEEHDAEVKQQTLDELRQAVIDEFQLPKDLADRLHGETKEELRADAKKLAEVIVPREAPDIDTGKTGGDGNRRKPSADKEAVKKPETWGLRRPS